MGTDGFRRKARDGQVDVMGSGCRGHARGWRGGSRRVLVRTVTGGYVACIGGSQGSGCGNVAGQGRAKLGWGSGLSPTWTRQA